MPAPDDGPKTADDAARLAEELRRTVSTFVRTIRQETGTERTAQSETLDLLYRQGPMTVAMLADRRGVTHQTMRIVVASLEETGAVRREPDGSDRRSRVVSITRLGRGVVSSQRNARASRIEDAIRTRLSPSERDQLRAAVPLLARLIEAAD